MKSIFTTIALCAAALWSQPGHALKLVLKPDEAPACEGVVMVALTLEELSASVDSFGVALTYDPAVLQYDGAMPGAALKGWSAADARVEKPGALKAGGFRGQGQPISPAPEAQEVLVLAFRWTCATAPCSSDLKVTALFGGIQAAQTEDASVSCGKAP